MAQKKGVILFCPKQFGPCIVMKNDKLISAEIPFRQKNILFIRLYWVNFTWRCFLTDKRWRCFFVFP